MPVSVYELRNAVYHFELVKLYKSYSNELFGLLVTEISNCDTEHSLRVVAEKKLSNYQKAAVIYIPASLGIIAVLSLVLILK